MSTPVFADASPTVALVTGRDIRDLSDHGYAVADAITEWLDSHPGQHTPSRVARAVKASTHEAQAVLDWLDRTLNVDASGNGCWRRYGRRESSAAERVGQALREAEARRR